MSLCKRCHHFRFPRRPVCRIDRQRVIPEGGVSRCADYTPDDHTKYRIMENLPENQKDIAHQIWTDYESRQEGNRAYLGMPDIGDPCALKIWYSFRHVADIKFDGQILAQFERGQNEKQQISKKLRSIAIKVVENDENGLPFEFIGHKGHFKGHMDAALQFVPEDIKTWHVGKFEAHNDKSWQDVAKNGVQKSKPMHYAQLQAYMGFSGMTRTLYVAINKNDDSIYTERIHFDKAAFEDLCAKAVFVIDAQEPPERLSNDPSGHECKWCEYRIICHEGKIPAANCRTCARSSPIDGGKWSCEKHGDTSNLCGDHLYIPTLLGKPTGASDDYVMFNAFVNATDTAAEGNAFEDHVVHTSMQLQAAGHIVMAADAGYAALRKAFAS